MIESIALQYDRGKTLLYLIKNGIDHLKIFSFNQNSNIINYIR